MKGKKIYIFLAIILVILIIIGIFKDKFLKIIYPKTYEEIVSIYAEKYKVEEELVFAVIKAESNFKQDAVSHRDAIGLMQIMEETAIDVAKKYGINIEFKIDSSILLKMEEIDICDIFSNILDNSIETAKNEENRNISLYLYKKTNYIIIKCENFYSNIEINQQGKFKTTKKDKNKHGHGLKIIQEIANKYNGEVNIKTDNNIFKILILIPDNIDI